MFYHRGFPEFLSSWLNVTCYIYLDIFTSGTQYKIISTLSGVSKKKNNNMEEFPCPYSITRDVFIFIYYLFSFRDIFRLKQIWITIAYIIATLFIWEQTVSCLAIPPWMLLISSMKQLLILKLWFWISVFMLGFCILKIKLRVLLK